MLVTSSVMSAGAQVLHTAHTQRAPAPPTSDPTPTNYTYCRLTSLNVGDELGDVRRRAGVAHSAHPARAAHQRPYTYKLHLLLTSLNVGDELGDVRRRAGVAHSAHPARAAHQRPYTYKLHLL
ncbi:hypothetical protein O0L34_g15951 [Tuta absoluta]|nr:hypothetical protein O0L34_g15951 [Tuta absoluta]